MFMLAYKHLSIIFLSFFVICIFEFGIDKSTAQGQETINSGIPAKSYAEIAYEAFINGDYKKALSVIKEPAADGSPDAQFLLGYLYENGLGVGKDETIGEEWIRKAAKQGYADAMAHLGLQIIRKYSKMNKSNTWESIEARINSCANEEADLWMLNAALMGQPNALLFQCISKSDKAGPPSLWPDGFAWCKVAVEQNRYATDKQIQIAQEYFKEVSKRLTEYDLKRGAYRAESILKRMNTYHFSYAKIEDKIKTCKQSRLNASKRPKVYRSSKKRRNISNEEKTVIAQLIAKVLQAGEYGKIKKYAGLINSLSMIKHPVKNRLLMLVAMGYINSDNPDIGLQASKAIDNVKYRSPIMLYALNKQILLGKKTNADRLFDDLKKMNLINEAMAVRAKAAFENGEISKSLGFQNEIQDEGIEREVKYYIIHKLVEQGQYKKAKELISMMDDDILISNSYMLMANNYIESGDIKSAIALKDRLDPYMHKLLMQRIAVQLANKKGIEEGLKTANSIEEDYTKYQTLVDICALAAVGGDQKKAFKIISTFPKEKYKKEAISKIAIGYAKAGNIQEAIKVIDLIEACYDKNNALIDIAEACVAHKQHGKAKHMILKIESDNSYVHIRGMIPIAVGLCNAGQFDEAKELVHQAIELIDDIPHTTTVPLAIYRLLDIFNEHTAQYQDLALASLTIPDETGRLDTLAVVLFHMGFHQLFTDTFSDGSYRLRDYLKPIS